MTAFLLGTLGVVVFVVGLAVSIALHECGHMVPAKRFGVRVPQFFVGFGKTLWSKRIGETEYGLKTVPLGGFVKLVGMLPPAKEGARPPRRFGALISDARAAEDELIRPDDDGRLFYQLPVWKKVVVMSGGPLVNIAIAYVLFALLFGFHGASELKPTVSVVSDCVIPASQQRACEPGDPVTPAKAAGFEVGDELVSFNGTVVRDWEQVSGLIRGNGSGDAVVVVERDGREVTLTTATTVSSRPDLEDSDRFVDVGFLGISPTPELVRHGPIWTAGEMVRMTGDVIGALVDMPVKLYGVAQTALGLQERDEEGPMSVVGASRAAGEIASTDLLDNTTKVAGLVSLLAGINIFLGVFNLVPLLPLDGGHIAGALYESLKRRLARLFGRPDPGHADVARMLPVAYVVAGVFIVMTLLLVYVDIVYPIDVIGS
ncbi:site-2 protease family protein [Alteromonas gracilis]